jgi:hypothetical protein
VSARLVVSNVPGGLKSLVAAPEPATWLIMGGFLLIALCKARSREAVRE